MKIDYRLKYIHKKNGRIITIRYIGIGHIYYTYEGPPWHTSCTKPHFLKTFKIYDLPEWEI